MPTKECSTALPLRQQIRNFILEQIQSGQLVPNDPIPSVNELIAQFGASKPTIHCVTVELIREGVLCRKRGLHGAFVADPSAPKQEPETPEVSQSVPLVDCKVECQCILGHRTFIPSGIEKTPACGLCGMPCRLTGRFSNPSLVLEPSMVVPPAARHNYYSVLMPDGGNIFMY